MFFWSVAFFFTWSYEDFKLRNILQMTQPNTTSISRSIIIILLFFPHIHDFGTDIGDCPKWCFPVAIQHRVTNTLRVGVQELDASLSSSYKPFTTRRWKLLPFLMFFTLLPASFSLIDKLLKWSVHLHAPFVFISCFGTFSSCYQLC